jgi:multiple sugar transport system ATP-binding protein
VNEGSEPTAITIIDACKTYAAGASAVRSVSLEVHPGEYFVLLGPSGSGKSTLLRLVAGLEVLDSGKVLFDSQDVTDAAPRDRDVAMVFQNYALYPHISVAENIAFGLRRRGTAKGLRKARVQEVASSLGIAHLLQKRPSQLSGGERQRVALGRAIARLPRAFLMDEPLSNLDATLRTEMRGLLGQLHQDLGTTTVYVTHDQTEAMTLGTRIGLMRNGELIQIGSPEALFERPQNLFVATFIGTPRINIFPGELEAGRVRFADCSVDVLNLPSDVSAGSNRVYVGIRPSDLNVATPAHDPSLPRLTVQVKLREYLGTSYLVYFVPKPLNRSTSLMPVDVSHSAEGYDVSLRFCADVPATVSIESGGESDFVVDPHRLYVFDDKGDLIAGPASSHSRTALAGVSESSS